MGLTIQGKVEVTWPGTPTAEIARRMRNPRALMRAIGVFGMAQAGRRLTAVLAKKSGGEAVRSGRLGAALNVGAEGAVFDLADTSIEFGSNLPYARQRQEGGPIFPKSGKALAIPLDAALARSGLWPRDFPEGALKFIPKQSRWRPNVIGLLVDAGVPGPLEKGKRKRPAATAYGDKPLFLLVSDVEQTGDPFLYFDDADLKVINEELWPKFIGL